MAKKPPLKYVKMLIEFKSIEIHSLVPIYGWPKVIYLLLWRKFDAVLKQVRQAFDKVFHVAF